jgi:glutamyl-tRNA synthetase
VLRPRARLLPDFVTLGRPYFRIPIEYRDDAVARFWSDPVAARGLLGDLREALVSLPDLDDKAAVEARVREVAGARNVDFSTVVHPLRVALTGMRVSPGIFDVLRAMGKDLALSRIDDAIAFLERRSAARAGAT